MVVRHIYEELVKLAFIYYSLPQTFQVNTQASYHIACVLTSTWVEPQNRSIFVEHHVNRVEESRGWISRIWYVHN